jgi:hypothetical protein
VHKKIIYNKNTNEIDNTVFFFQLMVKNATYICILMGNGFRLLATTVATTTYLATTYLASTTLTSAVAAPLRRRRRGGNRRCRKLQPKPTTNPEQLC